MSLAPAAQMAGMGVGGGRSHRRNPDYRRRTRQEAFNVFDLVNEGRASCRACHSVALSPPLIWSLVGLTAAQMKIKEEERLAFHARRTHSKVIKEENEQRMKTV